MNSVSIILSIHKESFDIAKYTIDSILSQDYKNIKTLILFDGNYPSQEPIKQYLKDKGFRYFEKVKSEGLASGLNFLIRKCKSDFIARIDADDIMMQDRISKQVQYLIENKDVDLIGTPAYVINNSGKIIGFKNVKIGPISLYDMLKNTEVIHPSVMVRKSFFTEYGYYDESLRYSQDLELWLKAISSGAQFRNLNSPLLLLRHDHNLIKKRKKEQKINIKLKKNYLKGKAKTRYLYRNYLIYFLPEFFLIKIKYANKKNI